MKKIIVSLLLLCSSTVALAEDYHWLMSGTKYSSLQSLCAVYGPTTYGVGVVVNYVTYSNGGASGTCTFKHPANSSWSATSGAFSRSGSGCTAPKIYDSVANACVSAPEPTCTPGREFSVTVTAGFKIPGTNTTTDMKAPVNVAGCRVYPGKLEECKSAPSGEVFCSWRVTEGGVAPTGESATAPATIPTDSKPDKVPEHNPAQGQGCPEGTLNLGIDSTGQSICGGSGAAPSTPTKTEVKQPTTTTSNADGSTTKVDVTTRTNSDGSTTTTTRTTTTGADGKVTTTEGSVTGSKPAGANGAGGGKGADDSSDEKKDDFCKQHPELNACKNSSVTGECEATACEGDAIQCAILRQQRKQYCEDTKTNPYQQLGLQAVSGQDPLKSTFPTRENAAQVNVGSLNQDGFMAQGASCIPDRVIQYGQHSVTLPFSQACDYLIILRFLTMGVAALASLKILSRPVLGS